MTELRKMRMMLPPLGDRIGPDGYSAPEFGNDLSFDEYPNGGAGLDRSGSPLPKATLDACRQFDAMLFGAVGKPRRDALPPEPAPAEEPDDGYGWGV